jgi:[acyl-carrier-protein] S-malonyltransferase
LWFNPSFMSIGMKTAFLFPGQGAQAVGMGKDVYDAFPAARAVFDAAEAACGLPLKKLCFEGPEQGLARTDVCQPAIFTVSAALLACLDSLLGPDEVNALRPAYMAGLSLGEYTALYAANMVGFEDAVRLVARRGAAMQAAATAAPSGMVSILGLDETKAAELCKAAGDGQVLTCANFNCPGQIVISGALEACRRAEAMAKDFGATGAVALKVAGAFHSEIMRPAAAELADAIISVQLRRPGLPAASDRSAPASPQMGQAFASEMTQVVSNVTAQPYDCPCQAPPTLLAQLLSPVRWQQSVEFMLGQGVQKFYEIGPGKVLSGLMRRIDPKADIVSLNSRQGLEKVATELGKGVA